MRLFPRELLWFFRWIRGVRIFDWDEDDGQFVPFEHDPRHVRPRAHLVGSSEDATSVGNDLQWGAPSHAAALAGGSGQFQDV